MPSRKPRPAKRHGRVRRWLVRPFFWALALLAALLLAAVLFVTSERAEEMARERLVAELTERLERRVECDALAFELLPPRLEISGLAIGSPDPETPDLLRVDKLEVDADLRSLVDPAVVLRRVRIEGLELHLARSAEGAANYRLGGGGGGGGGRALAGRLEIERLEVVDGALTLDDERLPLELEAAGLEAMLVGAGELELDGRVEAESVGMRLARGRLDLGAVVVRGRVSPGTLRLSEARAVGTRHTASASGVLSWGEVRQLRLDLSLAAEAGLVNEWGLTGVPVAGPVRFTGGFAWRPRLWGVSGRLLSPALRLDGRRFSGLESSLAWDRNKVRLDIERATHGGGAVRGSVAVDLRRQPRVAVVDLGLEGVALSRLLADQKIPLSGVEAGVSGPVNYRFEVDRPLAGAGWAELALDDGPRGDPGALRFAGSAPLTIDGGVVTSRAIRLESVSQRLLAEGFYDLPARAGAFDYELVSERLEEIAALLPGVGHNAPEGAAAPLWSPTAGGGLVAGTLELEAAGVATNLRLELTGVDAPGFTTERLVGSVRVSAAGIERMRLELMRPEAGLIVTGRVPFAAPGEALPALAVGVDAAGWPLADLAAWLPLDLPLAGPVSGRLELAGPADRLGGRLTAAVEPATLAGVAVSGVEVALDIDGPELTVEQLEVLAAGGRLALAGRSNRASGELALELDAAGFDLARPPLAAWTGGRLRGTLSAAGAVAGSWQAPRLSATLTGQELAVADTELGEGGVSRLEVEWRDGRVTAAGSLLGLAEVEGGGRADRTRLDVELALSTGRLENLLLAFSPRALPELTGELAGALRFAAGTGAANGLEAALELERLRLAQGELEISNLEPVRARLGGSTLEVDSLYLGQPGAESYLFLAGSVGLDAGAELDLDLQSTLDSGWFADLVPGAELRGGHFDAIGSISGSAASPSFNGVGELRDAQMVIGGLSNSLERLEALVLFSPGQVVLDRAAARVAGGALKAAGTLTPRAGWADLLTRLQVTATDVELRFPEGWLSRGDAELLLVASPAGNRLSGVVELDRALFLERVEVGAAALFSSLFERRRVEVAGADQALAATELDLTIRGADALRVRNNLADLEGSLDLSVRGSLARPVVFGEVELNPGGTLVYSGNDYEIERGRLTFANPSRIEPVVDLVARTELRDYDIVMSLAGTPERLDVDLVSDPPLANLQILSLLGGGDSDLAAADRDRGPDSSVGAGGFLAGQAASLLSERANRLFGLDRLRIVPLSGSSGDVSSARVTVGKRLSRDLFVTYSYDPSTTEQQILELEWSVSRSLVLVLTQNGDDSYAIDARWEKSLR